MWRTDYPYGEVTGYQSHTYGLNFFLPQHGTRNVGDRRLLDPFEPRRSGGRHLGPLHAQTQSSRHPARIANFKKYRPYYYEDYYPLTGIIDTQSDSIWLAYQMHRPSDNSGIVIAFRRPEAVPTALRYGFRA